MALVAVVLLIACTNLATLLAVRNSSRMRELTVRAALGAARSRLASQLLVESVLLAVLGAAAGWLVARWGVATVLSLLPLTEIPEALAFRTDLRLVAFLTGTSLASVLLFGVIPAWRSTRIDATAALRSSQSAAMSPGSRRLAPWLVAAQIALSVVLLAYGGLFVRTVRNAARVALGFDSRNLVQIEIADRAIRTRSGEARALLSQLVERVRAVPGVEGVTPFNTFFASWAVGIP